MYLKTLTLKGFKSFADATTIELEPGVTVVVGPNGSGKSNVVDAVAWVLGAQGPRVVRSSKMDDVIFAGTQKRSALGRAEVSLTIDNSARRLPIDFNEVKVTRTLFRTGESEYAINGAPCRLLDVQELLSDTGVGRQQHVIVGQGQLDAVLAARPEDRRAIIEEAAGVLKFRRRRERAERRLESSEAGLARLQDLLREVQRQLRPLERQAAAALRHDELVAEQRGLRLHLARAELGDLHERLGSGARRREELDQETEITGADLARTWATLSLAEDAPVVDGAGDLSDLRRRLDDARLRARQARALCQERRRSGARLAAALGSEDQVAALEAELGRVDEDVVQTSALVAALAPDEQDLERDEVELATIERERASDADESGDRSTGPGPELAEARAAVASGREALAAEREARARTAERALSLASRRRELEAKLAEHAGAADAGDVEVARLAAEHAELAADEERARTAAHETAEASRRAEEQRHAATARGEALELALEEARARAGVERLAELPGVVGTLLDVVELEEHVGLGFEAALAGTLDSVLVGGERPALVALDRLRQDGLGGAVLPLVELADQPGSTDAPPAGTRALRAAVRSPDPSVERLLDRLLDGVVSCESGLDDALSVAVAHPELVVVTPQGDRLSLSGWRLGAGGAGATRAALDAARSLLEAAVGEASAATAAATAAADALDRVRIAVAGALRALDGARTVNRAHAEQVAEIEVALASLEREQLQVIADDEASAAALEHATAALAADTARLEQLERAEQEAAARRDAATTALRAIEARARALGERRRDLEVRRATLEERRLLLGARREELRARVAARRAEEVEAAALRSRYERDDAALGLLAARVDTALALLDEAVAAVGVENDLRMAKERARSDRVSSLRSRRDALERVLAGLRDRRQRLDVELTEARVRHEAAVAALRRDLDLSPEELGEAPLPHLGAEADASARLRVVEAELLRIGAVNALARDELAALEERSGFLEQQLEDVRSARRELGQVISSIDREIVEVFQAAYTDVARHFADLFDTLFPGGTGRLSLSSPDDMLATGIEIDARPAGRNIRRLSLLSGGERSLVAMAFLFAVFRSRPSPFYLMDEVEAALDEVNLQRFLNLVEEFRDEAQLIIVSHQKRTMEIADALYGVTLQPGGASKVVSERIGGARPRAHRPTVEVP